MAGRMNLNPGLGAFTTLCSYLANVLPLVMHLEGCETNSLLKTFSDVLEVIRILEMFWGSRCGL